MARSRDDEAITIAFRLPRSLHEQLKRAAGKESNVSEEIRRRLEATFKIPDEATGKLIEAIANVAMSLAIDGGWDQDPFLFDVMKSAVNHLVEHWKPKAPPKEQPRYVMLPGEVSAEAAGQIYAGFALGTREWVDEGKRR